MKKRFNLFVIDALSSVRRVGEADIRWNLESGSRRALVQQFRNVRQLLSVVNGFDQGALSIRDRLIVQKQIEEIRVLATSYNSQYRRRQGSKANFENSITRLSNIYHDLVSKGREFCLLAIPDLVSFYDNSFRLWKRE